LIESPDGEFWYFVAYSYRAGAGIGSTVISAPDPIFSVPFVADYIRSILHEDGTIVITQLTPLAAPAQARGERASEPTVSETVCTYEAETWRRLIGHGELAEAPEGMVIDVIDRANGDVRRLVRADGQWRPE